MYQSFDNFQHRVIPPNPVDKGKRIWEGMGLEVKGRWGERKRRESEKKRETDGEEERKDIKLGLVCFIDLGRMDLLMRGICHKI